MNTNERYEKGLDLLKKLHGGHQGEQMVLGLKAISPEMCRMTIEWAFGEVLSRPELDLKTRELCIISACVMNGSFVPQLRAHCEAALNIGVTQQEIIEAILQMIFYAGMAGASNAMRIVQDVFAQRENAK